MKVKIIPIVIGALGTRNHFILQQQQLFYFTATTTLYFAGCLFWFSYNGTNDDRRGSKELWGGAWIVLSIYFMVARILWSVALVD